MDIIGDRRFVEIPGDRLFELPPLLVSEGSEGPGLDRAVEMASSLVDAEEMIPPLPVEDAAMDLILERRRVDLALQLVEQYAGLVKHWRMGEAILLWIRQCEATFESRGDLRGLLHPDVWPHAGRSSFVTLLRDKAVNMHGVAPESAVGMRLSFRQPPPLECFSDGFLLYLKTKVASTAYQTWAALTPDPISALPPERFHFDVYFGDSRLNHLI